MPDIKVSGFADLDVSKARELIAREWDERKPDEGSSAGYSPSKAFGQFSQSLHAMKHRIVDELRDLTDSDKPVSTSRIQDLKNIEILCFEAESSPNSDRRRVGLRNIMDGKTSSGNGSAEWKRFERIGGLDESTRPESRIEVSHSSFK